LQPVIPEPAPNATSSEAGTAAAAALGSATAQALWLESHLADVINALWRLLTHDLDRVLRGSADGAVRQLRDVQRSEDEKTVVSVQQAVWVLGIMGNIFKVGVSSDCYMVVRLFYDRFLGVSLQGGGGGCSHATAQVCRTLQQFLSVMKVEHLLSHHRLQG
jgi:hypothetical protein